MTARPIPERRSSGYSLDEAARLRQMLLRSAATAECPRCGVAMERTGGTDSEGAVWFLHCPCCSRSVVIRAPARQTTTA